MTDLDGWVPDPQPEGAEPTAADGQEGERKPYFGDPGQFVDQFLAEVIRRRLGGSFTWCPQWWKHAEAILRITAMWETWEHFRYEGALGMSTWLLHHADPHMAVLLSRDSGPFVNCKPDRHVQLPPLPHSAAPAGLWAAAAFSDPSGAPADDNAGTWS